MAEIKGLGYLVESSQKCHCTSRQRGHQLPITDCDCQLCQLTNQQAFFVGIDNIIWKPTDERVIED